MRKRTLVVAVLAGTLALSGVGMVSAENGHGPCLGQDMKREATTHYAGYIGDVVSSDARDTGAYADYSPGPRSTSIQRFFATRCP